jgi:uncharacterized protein YbaA (DUF1428 family)
MAKYVDGFVLTIPKKNTVAYKKMAKDAAKVWRKFGALSYRECKIDDPKPQWVSFTFPKMAKSKPGEQVWFSYIEYKSRAHRDQVNKKVMAYFDKKYGDNMSKDMPFDMKRMAYAGFTVEVGA